MSWMYRSPSSDMGTTAACTPAGSFTEGSVIRKVTSAPPVMLRTSVTVPTFTPRTRTLTAGKTWTARLNTAWYVGDPDPPTEHRDDASTTAATARTRTRRLI